MPGAAENMTLMSGDDGGRTNGELHTPLHSKLKLLQLLGPESIPKKKGMVTELRPSYSACYTTTSAQVSLCIIENRTSLINRLMSG